MKQKQLEKKVAVIMGSESDYPIMKESAKTLKDFGVKVETTIVSAHRTPDRMFSFAKQACKKRFSVIIAGAGGAAHLPGMIASLTPLPVIGVPIKAKALDGLDSLLSMVQMPKGIPVATVAINGSVNAAYLALRILGTQDLEIRKKNESFLETQKKQVEKAIQKIEKKLNLD